MRLVAEKAGTFEAGQLAGVRAGERVRCAAAIERCADVAGKHRGLCGKPYRSHRGFAMIFRIKVA